MAKLPWFKFNPSWWMSDTELSKCTPATRGVWIDLLCAMHQSGRSGELRGTTDQIARLARCSTAELTQALTELQTTGTADVTFRNNDVTVINRLMKREAKERKDTALRVKKHRSNDDVTKKKPSRSKKIEDRSKNVVVNNNPFFEFFRRASGPHITDETILLEIGKFQNTYPNLHPNQAGALINTWVANIGKTSIPETHKPKVYV
jgi:hypothetical protein